MQIISDFPVVLTIAGSDSSGGAGIQADLKTFQAFGCFGTSAITAITCQNTTGIIAIQNVEPNIVRKQIEAVFDDFRVQAVKTGALFSAEIIVTVQKILSKFRSSQSFPIVADPVMSTGQGQSMFAPGSEEALLRFLKTVSIVTPNIPEAESILKRAIKCRDEMEDAARDIQKMLGINVLIKGGHTRDREDYGEVIDVFFDGNSIYKLTAPRLNSGNLHGTGCTLSAAITSGLAQGFSLHKSIQNARKYLQAAMENVLELGRGSALLNHRLREPLP